MSAKNQTLPDAVFRAIADPTRREILTLLRSSEQSVGDIAENFPTSRPAISKHLRVLKEAGLITIRKAGTANMCDLNAQPLQAVSAWLSDYETLWGEGLSNLKTYLENE